MVRPPGEPLYQTRLGCAFLGDSLDLMQSLPDRSVNLVLTSPPYALHFKKEYGNADQNTYIDWFMPFAAQIQRLLTNDGSFVLNVGGAWTPGHPTRSLYHFELLLRLCRELKLYLAQEFYWYNPAKLPSPAEWVTVRKIRVKDAVECIWWLSKSPHPKADNQKVLTDYSPDMLRLIKKGYKAKVRPSGHVITHKFRERGGAIPPNVLIFGNNDATGTYMQRCKTAGRTPHPARFPVQLPTFFIRFLTDPSDLVLDPFAGSNTTGEAAEREKRHWLGFELERRYLEDSLLRFEETHLSPIDLSQRHGELCTTLPEPSLFGPT